MPRLLVACEFSGIVRDAFATRGWDAWSCDLLPSERQGQHIQGDVLQILDDGWDMMIAHPPCTHLAVSGAQWFAQKRADGRQQAAADFFMALIETPISRIAVENPIGVMSRLYRKPDQIIHPWMFGHPTTKATCLWIRGLPALRPTQIVEPEWHISKPGKRHSMWDYNISRDHTGRSRLRSITFGGIAEAMAAQWTDAVREPRPEQEAQDV